MSKNLNIQRPFVIKPPLETKTTYLPGESVVFDMVLVGDANHHLPHLVVTFRELGERGFGLNRAQYRLSQIHSVDTDGSVSAVYDIDEEVVRPDRRRITPQELETRAERFGPARELTLRFLTPTTLKIGGRFEAIPSFHALIKRLRDRVSALSYFYCGEALDTDFRALGRAAESISTVAAAGATVPVEPAATRSRTRAALSEP